jgi:hypothetical protein
MLKQVSMALASATVTSTLARAPPTAASTTLHHRFRNDGHHSCQYSPYGWTWYGYCYWGSE